MAQLTGDLIAITPAERKDLREALIEAIDAVDDKMAQPDYEIEDRERATARINRYTALYNRLGGQS